MLVIASFTYDIIVSRICISFWVEQKIYRIYRLDSFILNSMFVDDFWLGNEAIYRLTADNETSLRVQMTDIYGNGWRADYARFAVSDATGGYQLNVSGYRGNATDALSFQNGHRFSTADRDHDNSTANCAANYEGGWWYSRCQHANLNGKYNFGLTWFDTSRNQWLAIAQSEMKVGRPVAAG